MDPAATNQARLGGHTTLVGCLVGAAASGCMLEGGSDQWMGELLRTVGLNSCEQQL